ncbi:precorrin-8X/cobalt-precorrin-8 methylmutase [Enterococcus sp. PF1-24]|uniref:cobalt-precorrin-8 methylmutase n=1 Tax=unclassified Enterococcus TaxID=2608891 RepID=UPI002475D856|nr:MULTISPECIES: cobalt-precorrin-8 methylmutase [unclassified Enterococcus]MDH6363387.1 precorrin-8X/cobalt-precorrin-8 methylmutase [Enterococcus sp. PFB1-1]MDH6400312.1 precorrin-8X/cobalt-precorrin-8 methylmutase [Enterococcus sp. PF1-24]
MNYIQDPKMIEVESFKIIQSIIEADFPNYQFKDDKEEKIIKRAIHTSADFDYLQNLVFTHEVISQLETFFLGGKGTLFTDTTMALSGINKRLLEKLGIQYCCYIADPEVAELAKSKGITRSMAGIEVAAKIAGPKIFVIGNAPTAIFKILEMVAANTLAVEAVVGAPVGFVGAAESKEALFESQIPAIVARGRKGGSNVAAAIINAILYQLPLNEG